jgi:hypothetical protein
LLDTPTVKLFEGCVKKGFPAFNLLSLGPDRLQPRGCFGRSTRLLRCHARGYAFLRLDAPSLRVRFARR